MKSTLRTRITVRGRLSQRLAPAFDGLTLRSRGGATELFGEIADQTQLHSVLTRIRDLGLELESVSVVRREVSARKLGCARPSVLISNKSNKLEGGLR